MCPSTPRLRAAIFSAIVGTASALLVAMHTVVFTQPAAPVPVPLKRAMPPRQIGPWALTGWTRGNHVSHCAIERAVRDDGAILQFGFVRYSSGYRLVLISPNWSLTPKSKFPIALIAPPVLWTDANAVAVAEKGVVIEMGADGQALRKLATLSMLAIKAARATFKLPLDGLAPALADLDACFDELKAASAKLAASAKAPPARPAVNIDNGLYKERTFLTVPGRHGPYHLEALIVRPARATGRLPIALITHGKNATSAENMQIHADGMLPQARDLARRGWLAVVVIRRGYGDSDGVPGIPASTAYMACANSDLVRGFDVEAEDLVGALKVIAARPDADGSRAIAIGQSYGGGAVLALAARAPKGLVAVVNVSGGVWRTNNKAQACGEDDLVKAMAAFGARTRIPTLWLYAQNDTLFPPPLVTRMHQTYNAAGGHADLRKFPPVLYDGHRLFSDFVARAKWLRALDSFLQANNMPNANQARVDRLMAQAKLPARAAQVVDDYVSSPGPKFLAMTASRKGVYWLANANDPEGARERVLTYCREKSGGACVLAMENDEIVLPVVTGALESQPAVR